MHGALPADNIFLLALLLYNLSPCQAKNEEDNPVKNFFTDMNTAITSVIASKFNVAMRLLQQDFTKYFRAVLARWTQDLSVRTNEARFDNLDNFSDQEILAHAYKIANMSTPRTSNTSTTTERPSDAKEAEPLEDVYEEIVKISSVDEEEDTWDADLAVNDGSENSVNGDFDSGDDTANEFEKPDGGEPEIRVIDSAISLIDSESNAKNSDTESIIQSRDQVDSAIMNHSRDQADSDIMNLASQLARLNGTTRVSQDSLLDEADAIVDEERFKTLNALNVTSSNASTGTDIHVNDTHMTRPGSDVLISKSLKLPSEIINNEANKNVSDTTLDAVNVTFTKVTAINERYRNVTGFVLNAHSSAPENTSHEINIEHKHVTSAPHSSIAENMLHEINIDGKRMNMTNITFDASNLTTTDAGLNMDDKPKHVLSSIPMGRPSSLASKFGAALTNITSMKITQTGDNSATGGIIASNFSSVPIVSATFSTPTTEVNPGRSGTKLASESNFNEKKMPAPWPKATPSNLASKGNGSERRGFAELMIFDAADPALDEEQPLSPPFMKKDIIITHTVDLNARPPEPIKMTAEEHKLLRVKTPGESNRNGLLNSPKIDHLATPSSTYTKPPSKLRQKREISNCLSGSNPRFPLTLCFEIQIHGVYRRFAAV
ncbi:unnamed protein product [Bemisia tabaci]|uniref:Uncharacterized protein n=1 Tax=Bemisia tabaci TaxID=7038 RepID=A0A9P0EYY4_BEMTA|nr:unnamed protein product [Bemisia tabaci]